jgi:hypothetical protein
MVATAAQNITLLMDAWETGHEMPLLRSNGNTKAFNYGVFSAIATRTRPTSSGSPATTLRPDRQHGQHSSRTSCRIASVDPNHLQTSQLDFYVSGRTTTLCFFR